MQAAMRESGAPAYLKGLHSLAYLPTLATRLYSGLRDFVNFRKPMTNQLRTLVSSAFAIALGLTGCASQGSYTPRNKELSPRSFADLVGNWKAEPVATEIWWAQINTLLDRGRVAFSESPVNRDARMTIGEDGSFSYVSKELLTRTPGCQLNRELEMTGKARLLSDGSLRIKISHGRFLNEYQGECAKGLVQRPIDLAGDMRTYDVELRNGALAIRQSSPETVIDSFTVLHKIAQEARPAAQYRRLQRGAAIDVRRLDCRLESGISTLNDSRAPRYR